MCERLFVLNARVRACNAAALLLWRSLNASTVMVMVVSTQKTPFSTKKQKDWWGKFQKDNSKGFSGGVSGRVRSQTLGLSLHGSVFILEIGSSFGVNCHQKL